MSVNSAAFSCQIKFKSWLTSSSLRPHGIPARRTVRLPASLIRLRRRTCTFCLPEGSNVDNLSSNVRIEDKPYSGPEETETETELEAESIAEIFVSPIEALKEAVRSAALRLEAARGKSELMEEEAQRVAEAAMLLKDEYSELQLAAASLASKLEEVTANEVSARHNLHMAEKACDLADVAFGEAENEMQAALRSQAGSDEAGGIPEVVGAAAAWEAAYEQAKAELSEKEELLGKARAELERLEAESLSLGRQVAEITWQVAEKRVEAEAAEERVLAAMASAEAAVKEELDSSGLLRDAELALKKASASVELELPAVTVVEPASVAGATVPPALEEADVDSLPEVARTAGSVTETAAEAPAARIPAPILTELKAAESAAVLPELLPSVPAKPLTSAPAKPLTPAPAKPLTPAPSKPLTPPPGLHFLPEQVQRHLTKVILAVTIAAAGAAFLVLGPGRVAQHQVTTGSSQVLPEEAGTAGSPSLAARIREIPAQVKLAISKLPHQEQSEEDSQLTDVLWILLASVVFVFLFQMLPGGSPILGYLVAGVVIGPYGLSIIKHVHGTIHLAEFGVVFLMFTIGLELSLERLRSMSRFVFGLGTAQVLVTTLTVALFSTVFLGTPGNTAIILGSGLTLSSTAVVLKVLQERGENTSRHGRAIFSVLLFQDLAVVLLLILIPLLSPDSAKGGGGAKVILDAIFIAAVKAVAAMAVIIAGGRLLLRPVYKVVADLHNSEIFITITLLTCLATSWITKMAGLSSELGAFLAGLLIAETEYAIQVESDINPFRGLLLGLFFVTVGMSVNVKILFAQFPTIVMAMVLLIVGKTAIVAAVGRFFGLSLISAARTGLLLAPGGEFAFVAFGEAVRKNILPASLSSVLFLVVGLSMAITPLLAILGQNIASKFEQQDVRSLQPDAGETDDLSGHIIICGFGRVGQLIAQLMSERLIPFVALDVRSERVSVGRALELPVYFGDAGSRDVLHKVGADRAAAAVITLDTPGANYRTVWALTKNFPNVKTFVRAHDIDHAKTLEKAGATAVIPETLEPSLQLAAEVLNQMKLPPAEITAAIDEFRIQHLSELTELSDISGSSLGYGFSRLMTNYRNKVPEVREKEAPQNGKVKLVVSKDVPQEDE